MESRYVFRCIEDVIGSTYTSGNHQHSYLSRLLRIKFRENRDWARLMEMRILSLASVSSGDGVDTLETYETVKDLQERLLTMKMPYEHVASSKERNEEDAKAGKFDRYFKILREMQRKADEQKASKRQPDEKMV